MKKKANSITIFPMNMGGSNATRLELDAIFSPPYNAASYGISLTSSPNQADIVLLFGLATVKSAPVISRVLAALPLDVKLVALGTESATAAPFRAGYAVAGSFGQPKAGKGKNQAALYELVLPEGKRISAYIVGSPPDPQTIIDGILQVATL